MSVYTAALDGMMTGDIDLTGGTAQAWLVTSAYTPDYSTHQSISDVPSGARVLSAPISGRQVTGGVFTASPTTFEAAEGPDVSAVVVEVDGDLVAYVDDFGAGPGQTTLSLNGSDVTVNWAASGIIALG